MANSDEGVLDKTAIPDATGRRERRHRLDQPRIRTLTPVSWVYAALPMLITAGGCVAAYDFLHHSFVKAPELNGLIGGVFAIGVVSLIQRLFSISKESKSFDWQLGQLKGLERRELPAKFKKTEVWQLFDRLRSHGLGSERGLHAEAIETEVEGLEHAIERRYELGQFLVGALVALGLLGTFIGLLETLIATSQLIGSVADGNSAGGDIEAQFKGIVMNLKAPLEAMGTAFSASMFGLVGSIILGMELVAIRSAATRLIEGVRTGLLRHNSIDAHKHATAGVEVKADLPVVTDETLRYFVDFVGRHEAQTRETVKIVTETVAASMPMIQAVGEKVERMQSRLDEFERTSRAEGTKLDAISAEMKAFSRSLESHADEVGRIVAQAANFTGDALAAHTGASADVLQQLSVQGQWTTSISRLSMQLESLVDVVRSDRAQASTLSETLEKMTQSMGEQGNLQACAFAEQISLLRSIASLQTRAAQTSADTEMGLARVATSVGILAERLQTLEAGKP